MAGLWSLAAAGVMGRLRVLWPDDRLIYVCPGQLQRARDGSVPKHMFGGGWKILERPNSTDLLLPDLMQVLLDGKAYADADMIQSAADAGKYAGGFDYAMLVFKDLELIPDVRLICAVLDSPWCEKDSYADMIGRELLAKMQSNRGR